MEHPQKPKMQRKVAIEHVNKPSRTIILWVGPDLAEELKSYGDLVPYYGSNKYVLTVDARYQFEEVERYIQALG